MRRPRETMSFVKCDVLNEHTAKYLKSIQHLLEGPCKGIAIQCASKGIHKNINVFFISKVLIK